MTPIAWSWRDLALCRQVVTADYDPFFSDDPEDQDDALALCAVCPAQGACLAYAIRTAQPHGIWGGRPQAELQRLIARDRDGRPRRALIAAAEHHNAAKTRCRRGHPFDTANTYYDAAGKRRCRACLRAAWHRWKAERRQPTHPAPEGVVWMPEPSVLSPDTAIAGPPRPRIRRRNRQQGRAQRWDARPVLTARDAAALRFVGEQYAVRDDVLAVLLGRLSPAKPQAYGMLGPRTLRQRLGRWQQAGWVERRRLLGHPGCCRPAPACGWPGFSSTRGNRPSRGWPTITRSRSSAYTARPRPARAGWVCERELWRRRGKASWHLSDSALPHRSRRAGRGLARRGSWSRSS